MLVNAEQQLQCRAVQEEPEMCLQFTQLCPVTLSAGASGPSSRTGLPGESRGIKINSNLCPDFFFSVKDYFQKQYSENDCFMLKVLIQKPQHYS